MIAKKRGIRKMVPDKAVQEPVWRRRALHLKERQESFGVMSGLVVPFPFSLM